MLFQKICLLIVPLLDYILGFPLSRDFSNFQVPGLLDFFSPGTTGPWDLQGLQVPSCQVPGPSRDVPGCPGGTKFFFLFEHYFIFSTYFSPSDFFSSMVSKALQIKQMIIYLVFRPYKQEGCYKNVQLPAFQTRFFFLFCKFLLAKF